MQWRRFTVNEDTDPDADAEDPIRELVIHQVGYGSPGDRTREALKEMAGDDGAPWEYRGGYGVPTREEFERLKTAVEREYERIQLEQRAARTGEETYTPADVDLDADPDDGKPAPDVLVEVEYSPGNFWWYHDPEIFEGLPDTVEMARGQAETAGATPCPSCFPDTAHAESFDISRLPGGGTRYARKDIELEGN